MSETLDPPLPPATFEALRLQLMARRDSLPKRLAQVAAYAIENPDDVALSTASSLATRARVQPSTLVRFAQVFGYSGFADMQAVFRERLRDRVPSYEARLSALADSAQEKPASGLLFDGFADAAEHSIKALRSRLRPDQFSQAVDVLASAETIYLIGQRRSFAVSSYVSYLLGTLGIKHVLVSSPLRNDVEICKFANERDAALAISFTPYTLSTIDSAKIIAEHGARLVVITDSPFSPLLTHARSWFEVVETDFNGFRSLTATMTLSMTLAVAIANARRERST